MSKSKHEHPDFKPSQQQNDLSSPDYFKNLARDSTLAIFSFLKPKEVLALGSTCRSMRAISQDKQLWRAFWKKTSLHIEFHDLMYQWVSKLDRNRFEALVRRARDEYMPRTRSGSRENEVDSLFDRKNDSLFNRKNRFGNEKIMADIFVNGARIPASLNSILFNLLLKNMIEDIQSDDQKLHDPKYSIILQRKANHTFLSSVSWYAKAQQLESPTEKANDSKPVQVPPLLQLCLHRVKSAKLNPISLLPQELIQMLKP